MSLYYGDDFVGKTDLTGKPHAFKELFRGCSNLVSAENLVLPATTLSFRCYYEMFKNCTALVTAPALPSTTLADECYSDMFYDCISLVNAPELPATTLSADCYYYMFFNCISLTTAPVLPATTLVHNCYRFMFQRCSHLNYIKAMFTTTPGDAYTYHWVEGVAATGTFVKNSAATWDVAQYVSGTPSGWTIETASQ